MQITRRRQQKAEETSKNINREQWIIKIRHPKHNRDVEGGVRYTR